MSVDFGYAFPAIKGVQAGREYFASMCPLRLLPKLFHFNDAELPPELRVQRTLNKGRLPEMARYILDHDQDYIFSAITASIDAEVTFDPIGAGTHGSKVGVLHVPMDARFIINDGQHRRAAIQLALEDRPELGDETIAVVFFLDAGLQRCQQMFADLNRYAIRPTKSLGVLFDHRDTMASIARLVVSQSEFFRDLVEMERSALSKGSRKLFTLSSIYSATRSLLKGVERETTGEMAALAVPFWEGLASHMPEWQLVRQGKMRSGQVRAEYLHSHGIALKAFGRAGNALLRKDTTDWKRRLAPLKKIDWARSNTSLWEGRAMIGGRVSKSGNNVTLTTSVVKAHLGLPLSAEEQRVEDAVLGGKRGKTAKQSA